MRKETLRNIRIRTAVAGIAAISGVSGIIYPIVDAYTAHSPAKIQKRAEQLVPSYHPEEFQVNQQTIADFIAEAKKLTTEGAKTIPVPERITQAAAFIKDQQEAHNESRRLSEQMINEIHKKNLISMSIGTVLAVLGISTLIGMRSFPFSQAPEKTEERKKNQIPQRH